MIACLNCWSANFSPGLHIVKAVSRPFWSNVALSMAVYLNLYGWEFKHVSIKASMQNSKAESLLQYNYSLTRNKVNQMKIIFFFMGLSCAPMENCDKIVSQFSSLDVQHLGTLRGCDYTPWNCNLFSSLSWVQPIQQMNESP